MDFVIAQQQALYSKAVAALHALQLSDLSTLPALAGAAFTFGLLHALLPGHGKLVMTAHFAGSGQSLGALLASSLLILTHVSLAITFVLVGYVAVQRTLGGAGRAPDLELASHALIALIGAWMFWRAVHGHHVLRGAEDKVVSKRSTAALAVVAGLVPCPLTTFIMVYAVGKGMLAAGLILCGMFALGMITTVAAFPLAAVLLRKRMLLTSYWGQSQLARTSWALEVVAALIVMTIGVAPLARAAT